ncbi:hypothetical protein JYT26_01070 [Beggiatoa alba]|nr:hypothetical protein [Beggiatoa alba]
MTFYLLKADLTHIHQYWVDRHLFYVSVFQAPVVEEAFDDALYHRVSNAALELVCYVLPVV